MADFVSASHGQQSQTQQGFQVYAYGNTILEPINPGAIA